MNKQEYEQAKQGIITQYGSPEYDMGDPVNECATKLLELKKAYLSSQAEARKIKKLADTIKDTFPVAERVVVPPSLVKEEWLVSFNKWDRMVVEQWLKNTSISLEDLAKAVNSSVKDVKKVLASETFNQLRGYIANAWMNMLPLPAIEALQKALLSKTDATMLKAAQLILMNSGHLKSDQLDVNVTNKEKILDKETEDRMRKLGNQILGL